MAQVNFIINKFFLGLYYTKSKYQHSGHVIAYDYYCTCLQLIMSLFLDGTYG